jgi:hypothetical protein
MIVSSLFDQFAKPWIKITIEIASIFLWIDDILIYCSHSRGKFGQTSSMTLPSSQELSLLVSTCLKHHIFFAIGSFVDKHLNANWISVNQQTFFKISKSRFNATAWHFVRVLNGQSLSVTDIIFPIFHCFCTFPSHSIVISTTTFSAPHF